HIQYPARPPLAHPMHRARVSHGLPFGGGRHHFRELMSLRTAISSMASANSFFSFPFSSSSAFSRLASETSRPPNLAFHLSNVASDMPCLRHTSAVVAPASCSRRIPMICSSLNRLPFIVRLLSVTDSTPFWRNFRGSGQRELTLGAFSPRHGRA